MEEYMTTCFHCEADVPADMTVCPECGEYVHAYDVIRNFLAENPPSKKRDKELINFLEEFEVPILEDDLRGVIDVLGSELLNNPSKKLRKALDAKLRQASVVVLGIYPNDISFAQLYSNVGLDLNSKKFKAERKAAKKLAKVVGKKLKKYNVNVADLGKLINKVSVVDKVTAAVQAKVRAAAVGYVKGQVKDYAKGQAKGFLMSLLSEYLGI